MSRALIALSLPALLLACFAGCGNSAAARLAGKWELDTDKFIEDSPVSIKLPGLDVGGQVKQLTKKNLKVDIEFRTDGTLITTAASGILGGSAKSGTWKVVKASGDEVTISHDLVAVRPGQPPPQDTSLKFLDNDTIQTRWPVAGQEMPATFRRVKKS